MPAGNLGLAHKMLRCDWSAESTGTQTYRDVGDKSLHATVVYHQRIVRDIFVVLVCLFVSWMEFDIKSNARATHAFSVTAHNATGDRLTARCRDIICDNFHNKIHDKCMHRMRLSFLHVVVLEFDIVTPVRKVRFVRILLTLLWCCCALF